MKKGLLFLLVVLCFVPFVNAAENDVSLNRYHIQLGDSFVVDADNLKVNGDKFTGNAMIRLNGPDDEYTLLTHVFDGGFTYEAAFCKFGCLLPNVPGNYTVSVSLLDSSLVELEEILVPELLVVDSALSIVVELDKVQITPGESVKIEGAVQRKSDSQMLEDGVVKLMFDDVEYETALTSEKFVYEFNTGGDIESNYHDIIISIFDDQGNYGETTVQYFVVAVPQSLSIKLDKDDYLPGENIQITVLLNDQSGEDVVEEVELKIYNAKNKRALRELILSNEEFDFQLDEFAVPGEWKIMAKSNGLKIDKKFEVDIVEKLDIVLINQNLEVSNIGNIPYSKPIIIMVDNETKLEKRTNLDSGGNLTIVLYQEINEGKHTLRIENTDQSFEVDIVDNRGLGDRVGDFFTGVTGQATRRSGSGTSEWPFLVLVVFVVGLLVFVSVKLRMHRKLKFKLSRPKFSRSPPSVPPEDIGGIRERILKDIETSKMEKKEDNLSVQPIFKSEEAKKPERVRFDEPMRKDEKPKENNGSGNLFKMFD